MADENQEARVFIGNLAPSADQVTIRERFKEYGVIQGVSILKGFGFVQYAEVSAAQAAIESEEGTEFCGQTINVKKAKRNAKPAQERKEERGGGGDRHGGGGRYEDRGPRGGYREDRRGPPRGGYNEYYHDDYHGPPRGGPPHGGPHGTFSGGPGGGYGPERGGGGYRDGGYDRGGYGGGGGDRRYRDEGGPPSQSQPPPPQKKPCDCEIICVNKLTRQYCEHLENRLRNLGMDVDVLFPNPEIPLTKILGNCTSRGVKYAAVVTPLNEEHRSVTVNILQGQQQEHRNMPVEDAVNMLAKSFERAIDIEGKTGASLGDKHPPDVIAVLGFLADNRPLSVMEYDKLIKYLASRREQMLRMEYGDNIPAHLVTPPIGPPVDPNVRAKEEELKNKILGILNKPKETPVQQVASQQPKPQPMVTAQTSQAAAAAMPTINPSLQQAIDSLIKTGPNLLAQATQKAPSSAAAGGYGGAAGYAGSNVSGNSYSGYSGSGAGGY